MDNLWNGNESVFDEALLEKVNPVFNTGKMTLFQLAASGDADAAALAERMGLTLDETQSSANAAATAEQVLGATVVLEARYRTMARLAELSGYTLVDLPCGYTPRAVSFAKKGLAYYGLDLPAVIRETAAQVPALIPPERRQLARFRAVDATNFASLEAAIADVEGAVCVNTEGLLMYFTDSEAGALCDNICRILRERGGCWYTADVEAALQYVITMRALAGDRFAEIMRRAAQLTKDKSDVAIGRNTLNVSPSDVAGGVGRAMAFLARHGLKAERVPVAEHLPELNSLAGVGAETAAAIREGMRQCAYWKITPGDAAVELPGAGTEGFGVEASLQNGVLSLALTGRLDTITAPSLLAFFERNRAEREVRAVEVDCARLAYVSSAGLRVLLLMHKACPGGVTLRGANAGVLEILSQTGFDSLLTIA